MEIKTNPQSLLGLALYCQRKFTEGNSATRNAWANAAVYYWDTLEAHSEEGRQMSANLRPWPKTVEAAILRAGWLDLQINKAQVQNDACGAAYWRSKSLKAWALVESLKGTEWEPIRTQEICPLCGK